METNRTRADTARPLTLSFVRAALGRMQHAIWALETRRIADDRLSSC